MRTLKFCCYFLLFSLFVRSVTTHPTSEITNLDKYERFDLHYLQSRCGNIYIKYFVPIVWQSHFDTTNYILYSQYHLATYDPFNRSHFVKEVLPSKGILYSTFIFDESNISNSKNEAQYFFESSGKTWSNILVNQKKSFNINGNHCIKYDIENDSTIAQYYYFKRRKYSVLFSFWSNDKPLFKQKISMMDSMTNSIMINSL